MTPDKLRSMADRLTSIADWLMGESPFDAGDVIAAADYLRAQAALPIDVRRFERAPCYLCGYNGPGYFQPNLHPCASRYHEVREQEVQR